MTDLENIGLIVKSRTKGVNSEATSLVSRGLQEMKLRQADPRLPALIETLRHPGGWNERIRAWEEIRRLGPDVDGYVDCLLQALYNSDGWARILAAEALAWHGLRPRDTIPVLAATLDATMDHGIYDWARVACGALGRYASPAGQVAGQALPALMKALAASDPNVRAYAAQTLGQWGKSAHPALVPLAVAALKSEQPLRDHYLKSLRSLDPRCATAEDALLVALDDEEASVRRQALASLSGLEPSGDLAPMLLPLFGDDSPEVRQRLALTIGELKITNGDILTRLEHLSEDREPLVQLAAAFALVRLGAGDHRHLVLLRQALRSRRQEERKLAAWALGRAGRLEPWRSRRALKGALQAESSEEVRRALSRALKRLNG